MPYVVASQTIPILALAPILVRGLGSVLDQRLASGGLGPRIGDRRLPDVLPRHREHAPRLRSADPWARELMHSYAARSWTILWKLEVPSALPYIFTALKIAATASVVGAIIGEQTASISNGLGGAILNFNQYYVLDPTNLWATNVYAASARNQLLSPRALGREGRRAPRARAPRMSSVASVVSITGLSKVFGKAASRHFRASTWRWTRGVRFPDRPVGLREVDVAAHRRRHHRADRGRRHGQREVGPPGAARSRLRDRVPGAGPVRLAHRHEEHRSAARDARLGPREACGARQGTWSSSSN
jgi:hypothetical protein